jgi:hypothetical protein
MDDHPFRRISVLLSTWAALGLSVVAVCVPAAADEAAAKVTYDDQVVPILREKCFGCHNQDKTSGGLNLTTYSTLMEGGSSGVAVEPGDPDNSYLYLLVSHQSEPYMPPNADKLPDDTLAVIKAWIDGGLLENSGSTVKKPNKPKVDLALKSAPTGRPEGPPPMPGELDLEPVTRTARTSAVTALAASPWAPLVAVAGQKQVLLYHLETRDLLGVLPFPEGVPYVLKFSRSGQLLLAGGGRGAFAGKVVVWNVATGERLFEVGTEYDSVLAADISADQTLIALGGPGKVVRVYSTADGSLVQEIKKHTDWIYALEFSPDGVLLATADRNGGLFVWEAYTGRMYLELRGHSAAVTDVSWRIDSNILASASEDATIRLWEMENGGQVKGWGAHGGGAQSVEFAQDGRLISTGRDRVTRLWDQNGAQQREFSPFNDFGLHATLDGAMTQVIAGDWTGEVRVWNAADGAVLGSLSTNPPTLRERIDEVAGQLAARKQSADALQAAAAGSQTAAQAAADQLAATQKAAVDAEARFKAASDATASRQTERDGLAAARDQAQQSVAALESPTALLGEAAAKAAEASAKLPNDKTLALVAGAARQEADRLAASLAAEQKSLADRNTALAAADQLLAESKKAVEGVQAELTTLKANVDTLAVASQAAAQKADAERKAADEAITLLKGAESALARWQAALDRHNKAIQAPPDPAATAAAAAQ